MARWIDDDFMLGWQAESWLQSRCPITDREVAQKWLVYYDHRMRRAVEADKPDAYAYFMGKAAAVRAAWGH